LFSRKRFLSPTPEKLLSLHPEIVLCASAPQSFAKAGGLIGYGANDAELYRRGAYFVDRILKGAKPAICRSSRRPSSSLIINLKTAKAFGISIPQVVMLRAGKGDSNDYAPRIVDGPRRGSDRRHRLPFSRKPKARPRASAFSISDRANPRSRPAAMAHSCRACATLAT
jgi:hypothetical protein